ncbi:hypothetical protein OR571_13210 [Psychrobacillus sp. NEAU-3TGS]|uniref:hypothetical protein n=1 Tax=Psychrobacillus sp. NEAU-3TGS TaxID=2995412 RepID=UPI002498884A|nr:hypothetical protein [Psychrobacillus sp. NEAU-3TGS]MDI2588047.1 hypothetical protein [Psychrobacillus sp. NEAU-3TGS]
MDVKRKKVDQPFEESNYDFANQQSNEVATFKFTKQQLVTSKKYSHRQDALNVLLEEGKSYTFNEVDQKLREFLEGKVEE